MRTKHVALWLATLLLAGVVVAGDVVLPTFAQNLEGKGGNRWSTEIYLTNPNPTPLAVSLVDVYYGKVSMPHPCLPPSPVAWEIPPASSVGWMALAIWRDIGCPDSVVGGLMLRADGPFVVNSRMVNGPAPTADAVPLAGVSQEVPGIPVADLPGSGSTYILPALGWQTGLCNPPAFENYVNVVNPGVEAVTLTLQLDAAGTPGELRVNGRDVTAPYSVTLAPERWQQLSVGPPTSQVGPANCPPPVLRDLYFTVSGAVGLYASVVDRSSQDPRTVMPVKLGP